MDGGSAVRSAALEEGCGSRSTVQAHAARKGDGDVTAWYRPEFSRRTVGVVDWSRSLVVSFAAVKMRP